MRATGARAAALVLLFSLAGFMLAAISLAGREPGDDTPLLRPRGLVSDGYS